MESIIEKLLRGNWRIISGECSIPDKFSILKINGKSSPEASINLVIFMEKERQPRYFIKLNRTPNEFSAIEKEFYNLKRLRNILPSDLLRALPEPVFMGKIDDVTVVLIETFLPGKKTVLNTCSKLNMFYLLSVDWLKAFYAATKNNKADLKWQDFREDFRRVIDSVEWNHSLRKKLDTIFKKVENISALNLPVASMQGDFSFNNILINNEDFYIVDWESYREKSLPFSDMEFLIFHTALFFYKSEIPVNSFNRFFRRDSETFKLTDYYLERYCGFLKLEKAVFYFVSVKDTIDIINNGYGRHKHVPMQCKDFLNALVDVALRETN